MASRFTLLRGLWFIGLILAGLGLFGIARQGRVASLCRIGAAGLGMLIGGALTPLLRGGSAITYDGQANVQILTGSYVVGILCLILSAVATAWELGSTTPAAPSERRPTTEMRRSSFQE